MAADTLLKEFHTMTSVRASSRPLIFNGVKVFSATQYRQRNALGETVERWLKEHPSIRVADFVVTQSSDDSFHCISISVFYRDLNSPGNARAELEAMQ